MIKLGRGKLLNKQKIWIKKIEPIPLVTVTLQIETIYYIGPAILYTYTITDFNCDIVFPITVKTIRENVKESLEDITIYQPNTLINFSKEEIENYFHYDVIT